MSRKSVKKFIKQIIVDTGANIGEFVPLQVIRSEIVDRATVTADDINLAIEDLITDGEIERTSTGNIRRLK